MPFSSPVFLLLFLPLVISLYFIGYKSTKYKNAVLLLASIIFYAWGEPIFVFIMTISILVNYLMGLGISRSQTHRKGFMITAVIWNLGLLFLFKYLSFVSVVLHSFMHSAIIDIALPIGISFFTFQILSYIWDVYYGKTEVQKNPLDLALYITMFPQLIAGPIVRYNTISSEIRERKESFSNFSAGCIRFVLGLSKKVLVADFLAGVSDSIFKTAEFTHIPLATAWIGAIAYTLQIYYDFSGYSDMAIGLGRCFGFTFPENFNYPYISSSISEFWKRWHISLTDWFRDYVYIPLGGNRVSKRRYLANFILIWTLSGIWHGAGVTFIIWGLLYCFVQIVERETGFINKIPKLLGRIYTLLVVNFLWVIFRSTSIGLAIRFIEDMIIPRSGVFDENTLHYFGSSVFVLIIAIVFCTPVVQKISQQVNSRARSKSVQFVITAFAGVSLILLYLLSVVVIADGSYSPFIYFNF